MKKLLLIVFVLAICLLAMPQGVMAVDVVVNAQLPVQPFVFDAQINPAATPWPWVLAPDIVNDKNDAINLSVISSRDWDIIGWDATPVSGNRLAGHMYANGHPLLNGLKMQMGGVDGTLGALAEFDTAATPGQKILSGHPAIGTQTDFSDIQQLTVPADFGSTGYQITLWFEASEVAAP